LQKLKNRKGGENGGEKTIGSHGDSGSGRQLRQDSTETGPKRRGNQKKEVDGDKKHAGMTFTEKRLGGPGKGDGKGNLRNVSQRHPLEATLQSQR